MKVTGLALALLDIAPERDAELHAWYEGDHLPENLALDEVTGAARYVAAADCLKLAGPREPEAFDGVRPRHLTVYQLTADDLPKAAARWWQLGTSLVERGRSIDVGFAHAEVFQLEGVLAREGVPVSSEAIPHLAHTGVLFTLTRIPEPELLGEMDTWWTEVHGPDVLQVPGFLAGLRLHAVATGSGESPPEARALNVYLLDDDPANAVRAMGKRVPEWKERGRLTSPAGAAPPLWNCPYRRWTPTA